jgi:hypothetical protein
MIHALLLPTPLDVLTLPAALDGRDGTHRSPGRRLLAVDADLNAIRAWPTQKLRLKTTAMNPNGPI